ncbi:hypothetical protein HMSSN139_67150 [Paenibacillus sp. HMSSN-139]|nr:hypothetical protein HMSSN139_67150 [Paenibacillus sp. HMSSN-139]
MAIAEVTVIPIGTGSTSLSAYVAELHRVLEKQTGITFTLTSMSTIIEGPLDDVFAAIRAIHEAPFQSGAPRVDLDQDRRPPRQSQLLGAEAALRSREIVTCRFPNIYACIIFKSGYNKFCSLKTNLLV